MARTPQPWFPTLCTMGRAGPMTTDASSRGSQVAFIAGVVALVASLVGLVLGWVIVDSVIARLEGPVRISVATLDAIEETLGVVDSVTSQLQEGLTTAGESLDAASTAAAQSTGSLTALADFLDGDLVTNIEAIQGTMPAAIQAAGAIDSTLRALSLLGVDYDPEQPFDEALTAIDAALEGLPGQLSAQAGAVRDLVPSADRFSEDAATIAASMTAMGDDLERSGEVLDSYRATIDEARAIIEDTEASFSTNLWMLRGLVLLAGIAGVALSTGLMASGRRRTAATVTEG